MQTKPIHYDFGLKKAIIILQWIYNDSSKHTHNNASSVTYGIKCSYVCEQVFKAYNYFKILVV
jgi:hypothetical protein